MSDSKPYKALGRGFLMVDELPEGALPRYERNVQFESHDEELMDLPYTYTPIDEISEYMSSWMNNG